VAGASKMPRSRFMMFNIIGGIIWGAGMPMLGYFIGKRVPGLDKYIELVIIAVVGLSIVIAVGHLLKDPKTRKLLGIKIRSGIQSISLNKRFGKK